MNYKNLNLDFYDDSGKLLKAAFPNRIEIPSIVKEASVSSDVSDNNYALIMSGYEGVSKKYPLHDAGNTWLSSLYYCSNRDKLPEEAQKVASSLIKEACVYYNINVPAVVEADSNPNGMKSNVIEMDKLYVNPSVKTASERIYAIGNKYPIDSPEGLKQAKTYFDENYRRMKPIERREFAVKVASVSKAAGMPIGANILNYSGDTYSDTLDAHLAVRYQYLNDLEADEQFKHEIVKLANIQKEIAPVEFAMALEKLDIVSKLNSYWDRDIADPWYSTFNIEKNAMGTAEPKASFTIGEVHVTENELKTLAKDPIKLEGLFGSEFSNEFIKNPIDLFKSMPRPQQKIIGKMAIDTAGKL